MRTQGGVKINLTTIAASRLASAVKSTTLHSRLGRTFLTGLLWFAVASPVTAVIYETDTLKVYGDFRVRGEYDWNSQNGSGVSRDDRGRLRVRARLGMNYMPTEYADFGLRLRTGSDDSQQSPHITVIDFDDNDTGDADLNFDKWFLKGRYDAFSTWVGRNSLPIWKPNELFWDDDVTPAGVAAAYKSGMGESSSLGLNAGYYSLPAGMREFCGNLGQGQAVFTTNAGDVGLTFAAGGFKFMGDSDDSDCQNEENGGFYLQDNGLRDYTIWVGNVQGEFNLAGRPVKVGGDYMYNSEKYDAADQGDHVTVDNEDQTNGWDVYVTYGDTRSEGNWLVGYWYAHIEQFAVNNSMAQDDWVRWGSATQTRASNMKGHEFRGTYALMNNMNLVARLYLVDAVKGKEDGNRFRLDFNYKF